MCNSLSIMEYNIILFVLLCIVVCVSEGKTFTRCQLAKELLKTNMKQKSLLGNWVCLIEKASNRNTSAFVVSPSGKKFYGLYQIPSRWCKEKKRGGDCNIKCEDLLDEDIRDDTACAVMIYQQEGFKYWPAWNTRCKNDNFITNEIYKCPDLRFSPDRSSPVNFNRQDSHIRYKRSSEENHSMSSIYTFFKVTRLKYLSRRIN